ncbi:hypothetical protein VB264_24930 [Arcicella aquatica]|uniref:Uncharacterized protein n=1 Tax=Arcicella aquatica TaxID=217141 RepID=A0ABU5QVB9_9BACT|nr:hypothetical protein [Arcicella aquatica]MEA5261060.1 hypothetical protein [Arcicella aquatica]
MARLNQEKYRIQKGFNEKLEKELVNLEPKQAEKIREMIDYKFSDNEYKNLDNQQMKNVKGDVKDVKSSFNYMESLHYRQFSPDKSKEAEPAPNETEKSDVHAKNTPESFISQYKYPQTKDFDENTKDIIDKEKESEPSKSGITKSDPQSKNMPESFMAQYELPKPKDFSENSKDVAEKKKLDIDKDRD